MNKLYVYKLIDEYEDYVYICVNDDCCVDVGDLYLQFDKDRSKVCDELDLLGVEYYVVFPEDIEEVF